MSKFDYGTEAELYPTRFAGTRPRSIGYRRFPKAAEAIRFAVEELSPGLLLGTYLEVADERYDGSQIRALYDSDDYPLIRRADPGLRTTKSH